jgi:hypothetical protein
MPLVINDEEGNEIEVSASEWRAQQGKVKPVKSAATKGQPSKRPIRAAQPPSWNRALKRGGMWGGLMLVVVVFFFQGMPLAARVGWGVLYAVAFIPLTYWIDRVAYRSYLKRSGTPEPPARRS